MWNLQVCYHTHNSLLLVPVMSQNNPVQALPSYSLKTHCNTISPSMCRSSKWSFSPIHATCPAHHILLDLITQGIFGEEYWSQNSSFCSIPQFPVTSPLLSANISLSTLLSNTLSLGSFLNVRDHVSHLYKRTGKLQFWIFYSSYFWKAIGKTQDSGPNCSRHSPSSIST